MANFNLNMCDVNEHDAVAFVGRECPMCKLLDEIYELKRLCSTLQAQIDTHVCGE
jgi:phage FluMu protein Com